MQLSNFGNISLEFKFRIPKHVGFLKLLSWAQQPALLAQLVSAARTFSPTRVSSLLALIPRLETSFPLLSDGWIHYNFGRNKGKYTTSEILDPQVVDFRPL
jgi:hypothetical protein